MSRRGCLRMWMWAVTAFGVACRAGARDEAAVTNPIAFFQPAGPTLALTYDVSYRFLFIDLITMGRARLEYTEGCWTSPASPSASVAFLEFRFDSFDQPEQGNRGRISIHSRVRTVLKLPDLGSLIYSRDVDEVLNPLLRHRVTTRYREAYDFQSGALVFRRDDLLTGAVQTNVTGVCDPTMRGREIPLMLQRLASVYHGREPMLTRESGVRVSVNVDGVMTPFILTTQRGMTAVEVRSSGELQAMQARFIAAPEAGGRGRTLTLWTASLADVAAQIGDAALARQASALPDWALVPLQAEYGLAIGRVRSRLTGITLRNN